MACRGSEGSVQAVRPSGRAQNTLYLVFFGPQFFSTTLAYISTDNDAFNACPVKTAPEAVRALRAATYTMRCTHCDNEDTKVIETREAGEDVRRRRECPSCGERFTTYERVERPQLRVIKKDGSRELFDREKMLRGMLLSCEKRPVATDKVEEAARVVEDRLRGLGETEVQTKMIGDLIMEQLRKLDHVAYIRFASVYKDFRSVRSFEKEIKVLTGGK